MYELNSEEGLFSFIVKLKRRIVFCLNLLVEQIAWLQSCRDILFLFIFCNKFGKIRIYNTKSLKLSFRSETYNIYIIQNILP